MIQPLLSLAVQTGAPDKRRRTPRVPALLACHSGLQAAEEVLSLMIPPANASQARQPSRPCKHKCW